MSKRGLNVSKAFLQDALGFGSKAVPLGLQQRLKFTLTAKSFFLRVHMLCEASCTVSPAADRLLTMLLCFPAVSTVQVHRAEGRSARPNANNKFINKTENGCCPASEVWLKRPGGSCWAIEETGHKITGLEAV